MIKTFFYLKTDKQNNNGEYPIFAKIKLQGKTTTLSTGKYISKERWLFTNKLRNNLRLNTEKNCKITVELLERKIEDAYYELSKIIINPTLIDVKNKLKGIDTTSTEKDIINLFKQHNNHFYRKVQAGERSKASLQKYNRAKDLLVNYIKTYYKKSSYKISDINNKFVYDLESYLKYDSVFNGKKGISHNSVVKYIQCYKTVCKFGIKRNIIQNNPFLVYDEKLIIKDAIFLTTDELKNIENKQLSTDRLNKVKDIFLFSCYTGYAPVDLKNLTKRNLIKDNDGTLWIKVNRAKTNTTSNVPVLQPVQRILDKYSYLASSLLPDISNQKINEYLKEIADLCNIDKKLTHYVARHTFATTITLGNGVKVENVSKMMGHTNVTMTQHYAKILDRNVKNDMNKLNEKYQ